jgi:non-specific serine/threonine protein kinase
MYYVRLAEEADKWLWGKELFVWLEREHDNLRAALAWSLERVPVEEAEQRKEVALRLGGALHRFWFSRGHFNEGRAFLERALAASSGLVTASRAKALVVAADLASDQGDMQPVETLAEESLALSREAGDALGIARALGMLGRSANSRYEYARARSLLEESVALCQELGNHWYLAWSLFEMGNLDAIQGEHIKAQAHFEEALALWRELGDRECTAIALNCLAVLPYHHGDLTTARSLCDEAIMHFRELGSSSVAEALGISAKIALSQGDLAAAHQLSEEAVTRFREMNNKWGIANRLSVLARVEARLGDYARTAASPFRLQSV